MSKITEWWYRRTHRRGGHNWRHIADRVYCVHCQKWWTGA